MYKRKSVYMFGIRANPDTNTTLYAQSNLITVTTTSNTQRRDDFNASHLIIKLIMSSVAFVGS